MKELYKTKLLRLQSKEPQNYSKKVKYICASVGTFTYILIALIR